MADNAQVVGQIASISGEAVITTAEGSAKAVLGTEIHLNDRIETGPNTTVELLLADGTKFAIAPGSEMEITKLVYDPQGSDNGLLIDVPRGAFEFVAGKIAPLFGDGMQVATPAGSLGVRGTAGAAREDPVTGSWSFMLLKDPNGHLGKIALITNKGEVLLDEWMEASRLDSIDSAPEPTHVLTTDQVRSIFGNVHTILPILGDQTGQNAKIQSQKANSGHILAPLETTFDFQVAVGELTPITAQEADLNGDGIISDDELDHLRDIFHDSLGLSFRYYTDSRTNVTLGNNDGTFFAGNAGGNHTFDGGSGTDTIDYSVAPAAVDIHLASNTVNNNGQGGIDTILNFENVSGSTLNDTIDVTGAGANIVHGRNGNDTITADSNDTVYGDGGDDTINMGIPTTGGVHGGTGTDIWHVQGTGGSMDIGTLDAGGKMSGIEQVDLTIGNSQVTLSVSDVFNMSDNDTLMFFGDAGDTVDSVGNGWVAGAQQVIGGNTFDTYTFGAATLLIEDTIVHNIS